MCVRTPEAEYSSLYNYWLRDGLQGYSSYKKKELLCAQTPWIWLFYSEFNANVVNKTKGKNEMKIVTATGPW
jgi:hypothetical protein